MLINLCTFLLCSSDKKYTFLFLRYKLFLYIYCIVPHLSHQHFITCFLLKDIDILVESWRNQFLGFFLQLCCFLSFILDLPLLYYLLYFIFSFFFSLLSFFYSFSSHLILSSFLSSPFLCFFHPNFPCFSLYYFPYSSKHFVIFTSPIFQSILALWQASYGISKIIFHLCSHITSISVLFLYLF